MSIMTENIYMDEPKKKNVFQKIKEKFDDKEEQFEYISVLVRLLVVFWSGALVTLNYLPKIPGLTSGEKQDITFPASLLASSLASFGLEGNKKRKEKAEEDNKLANSNASYQTIRVETPIKILGAEIIDPPSSKK